MSIKWYGCVTFTSVPKAVCRTAGFPPCLSNLISEIQLKSPPKIISVVPDKYVGIVEKKSRRSKSVRGA